MNDDRKLGDPHALDYAFGPVPVCIDNWPLGVPVRVTREYEAKHKRLMDEINRLWRLQRSRDVQVKCMTQSDWDGLKKRGIAVAALEGGTRIDELRLRGTCGGCGVATGSKHFLSCWVARPALLDAP